MLHTKGTKMENSKLSFRSINEHDIEILTRWLNQDFILKWYHNPEEWLTEIKGRHDVYSWIHHFIVMDDNIPIGFCQYYDCCDANDMEDWYNVTKQNDIFSIDYLIGNDAYLGKGYGKAIVCALTDLIKNIEHARKIIVRPDELNLASKGVLLANRYSYDAQNKYFFKSLK